ncbi:hypothetical protein ACLOJK_025354 [Asimina triloba]
MDPTVDASQPDCVSDWDDFMIRIVDDRQISWKASKEVLKKQSSCSVQLSNYSDQYVAFKVQFLRPICFSPYFVKTTSPRRYCVRPNTGVVLPKSNLVFTVTMQSPREAPPDMQCKDKFLIQSTIVPFGTNAEDIKPTLFTKENGRYVEENKLKVVLISPPHSPVLLPINGVSKQEQAYETPISKQEPITKDQVSTDAENLPPSCVAKVSEDAHATKLDEDATKLDADATKLDADATKLDEDATEPDADATKLDADATKLDADATRKVDDLKMKLDKLESQLNEVQNDL